MIGLLNKIWIPSAKIRRRRALNQARRQLSGFGYKVDRVSDSQLEHALTRGQGSVEDVMPLTGRTINWALRRLSQGTSRNSE